MENKQTAVEWYKERQEDLLRELLLDKISQGVYYQLIQNLFNHATAIDKGQKAHAWNAGIYSTINTEKQFDTYYSEFYENTDRESD